MSKIIIPEDPAKRFKLAKALAYFAGNWEDCAHSECRKRKLCTGGPRGSFRKFKGDTFCKQLEKQNQASTLPFEQHEH